MYKNYNDIDVINAVKNSNSIAGTLRILGLKPAGGNYLTIKLKIKDLNLDVSHWVGSNWSKGKQLKKIGNYSKPYLTKKHLASKRTWTCEQCKLSHWQEKPIPLECHHINGDRANNSEENLKLLCRNCHAVLHNRK